jgi:hypothetical protein
MNNEDAAEKLLLSKIMKKHRKSKDQRLRASSLIEVVDKCYMEASKDIMFSVFCQSRAKCLSVEVLDKSKKKLVKGWIIDLNKANKLVLPMVNKERVVFDRRKSAENGNQPTPTHPKINEKSWAQQTKTKHDQAAERATDSCKDALVFGG